MKPSELTNDDFSSSEAPIFRRARTYQPFFVVCLCGVGTGWWGVVGGGGGWWGVVGGGGG